MKKTNNKGFSLVELIVVIAIMAVLIGVLAPQFLKYVERSRKSVDVQNVASIVTALQAYAADPMVENQLVSGTITLKAGGTDTVANSCADGAGTNATIAAALTDAGFTDIGLKSQNWTSTVGADVVLTVTVNNGSVKVTTASMKDADHDILTGKYK